MTRNSDRLQWKSVIASFVVAISLLVAGPLFAQDEDADIAADEDSADLGKLKITGSRISRTDVEGPSPIVIVTREDIEKRGFSTVYQALENLPQNTGTLQGEQYTNSFTPNAQSLSLRSPRRRTHAGIVERPPGCRLPAAIQFAEQLF